MKTLELNRIALWRSKLAEGLTVRESGAGRIFAENHIIKRTTSKTYRYAKNYESKGVKFSILVVSYISDSEAVEKQLDKIAKKIDLNLAKEISERDSYVSFEFTDFYLEEK